MDMLFLGTFVLVSLLFGVFAYLYVTKISQADKSDTDSFSA